MIRGRPRVSSLSQWHRIKSHHHIGRVVDAIAVRKVGFGLLCCVGRQRIPAILRSREISWDPSEQTNRDFALDVGFQAVVIGYSDSWRELILSKKAHDPSALDRFLTSYPIDTRVEGVVKQPISGGFVVRLEGGVEGYVSKYSLPEFPHASRNQTDTELLLAGDTVGCLVQGVDDSGDRVRVSVRKFLAQHDSAIRAKVLRYKANGVPCLGGIYTPVIASCEVAYETSWRSDIKRNILLIEDREGISLPACWVFKERGHQVALARTYEEAVAMTAERSNFDIILVDLQMRYGDAIRLCSHLREKHPNTQMFVFTGNPAILGNDYGASKFADGFLVKPVDVPTLVSHIEGRLNRVSRGRTWEIGDTVNSFIGHEGPRGVNNEEQLANDIIDSFLREASEIVPDSRIAVLSYDAASNTIDCVHAHGISNDYFARFRTLLPFSKIGDVMTEHRPCVERVDLFDGNSNPLVRVMKPIDSWIVLGFPLNVESMSNRLGFFLFGPKYEDRISKEKIREIRSIANALACSIERARIDIELGRHQRAICAGSLVLGMTHEIRNSIQSLDLYGFKLARIIGQLRDSSQRNELTESVNKILSELDSLKATLELFLGTVRLEECKLESIKSMLQKVIVACEGTAQKSGILLRLDVRLSENGPFFPNILRQAFINLILNAIQHTSVWKSINGLVEVVVEESEVEGQRFIDVTFKDNGIGMHAIHRDRVFDMFFTTRENGSGLGLYVTQLIVESVGGEVSVVETIRFIGTTFRVRLPYTGHNGG